MLRLNNDGILIVPPFECAWLTGNEYTLRSGAGCLSFEAKGETDVTIIFKSVPGAKRLQPLQKVQSANGARTVSVEQNYTVILGSHRNSCLKFEKNGVTKCMVPDGPYSRVSSKEFTSYFVDYNKGLLTVGCGAPDANKGVYYRWSDPEFIPDIQHVGLSCWDRHVSYRNIEVHPPLDFTAAQELNVRVPGLFDLSAQLLSASLSSDNVFDIVQIAELLLPNTRSLYRKCLDYIAEHFASVAPLPAFNSLSAPLLADLLARNSFSVGESELYTAAMAWARAHHAAATQQALAHRDAMDRTRNAGGGDDTVGTAPGVPTAACGACGTDSKHADEPTRSCSQGECSLMHAQQLDEVAHLGKRPGPSPDVAAMPTHQQPRDSDACAYVPVCRVAAASGSLIVQPPLQQQQDADMGLCADGSGAAQAPDQGGGGQTAAAGALCSSSSMWVNTHLADVDRVLCLVRYPLLPVAVLTAALNDPLLVALPGATAAAWDALDLHLQETGGGSCLGASTSSSSGSGGATTSTGAAAAALGGSVLRSSSGALPNSMPLSPNKSLSLQRRASLEGRRLVRPPAPPTDGMLAGASSSRSGDALPGAAHAAADAQRWCVRYQRRNLPSCQELLYVCDGDTNGVLHYLGTLSAVPGSSTPAPAIQPQAQQPAPPQQLQMQRSGSDGTPGSSSSSSGAGMSAGRAQAVWVNPALSKAVDVKASSPAAPRTTDLRAITGRQFMRTNFAGPRYVDQQPVTWWQVDLGASWRLILNYYTIRHDGSHDYVRSWVLQGSQDLTQWVDLKRHVNDTSLKVPGQYASWPVVGPAAASPYRAFRLLLAGDNASPNPENRHNFPLSNLEFYGYLVKVEQPSGAASGAPAGTAAVAHNGGDGSVSTLGAGSAAGAEAAAAQSVSAGGANTASGVCAAAVAASGSDAVVVVGAPHSANRVDTGPAQVIVQ